MLTSTKGVGFTPGAPTGHSAAGPTVTPTVYIVDDDPAVSGAKQATPAATDSAVLLRIMTIE